MLAAAHGELVRLSSAVIGPPWLVVTVIARVPSVGRPLVAGVPTSLRLVLADASCGVQRQVSSAAEFCFGSESNAPSAQAEPATTNTRISAAPTPAWICRRR